VSSQPLPLLLFRPCSPFHSLYPSFTSFLPASGLDPLQTLSLPLPSLYYSLTSVLQASALTALQTLLSIPQHLPFSLWCHPSLCP
jgi:hypothetical protein